MHNMEKCGWGKGRPQGCSLRSHRRRRLAPLPLPPPFSPAPMLRHVVYASLLHFGVESAVQKRRRYGNFAIMQKPGSDFASLKAPPLRILVTGFGRFPGVHDNPTALLIHALGKHRTRLARLGIALEGAMLPVEYAGVAKELEDAQRNAQARCHSAFRSRRTAQIYQRRNAGAEPLEPASLRRCRRTRTQPRDCSRCPACGALHLSRTPNRSRNARRWPQSPLVGQCGRLCLQRDAISFAFPLARARGRFHSCAAARACKPAKGGIAEPPPRSREPHPRRSHRDPRHRAKAPPRSCASARCDACAQRFCEDAREAPGA